MQMANVSLFWAGLTDRSVQDIFVLFHKKYVWLKKKNDDNKKSSKSENVAKEKERKLGKTHCYRLFHLISTNVLKLDKFELFKKIVFLNYFSKRCPCKFI